MSLEMTYFFNFKGKQLLLLRNKKNNLEISQDINGLSLFFNITENSIFMRSSEEHSA